MAIDITTIGIAVDTNGVVKGSKELDKLATSADKASRETDNFGKSSISAGRAVGIFAGIIATLKISSFVKEMATLNARYETLGVVMNVVGRNAGYSSTQMTAHAEAVRKMGITMIESRNTVVRMAQAQLDLTKASSLARVAQDAAVLGGINSSEALERIVSAIQKGEVEILKTIGINVRWESSYKDLAKELGKNTTQLTEAEKTQARLNIVLAEGIKIQGAYEASMGTAGKQMASVTRYLEDLKVIFGETFNEALTIAVFAVSDALKELDADARLLAQQNELKQWGESIVDIMAFVGDSVASVGAVFRLTGSHIAEFIALRSQGLDTFLGGGISGGIKAAAEADRAKIMDSTKMFRNAVDERRRLLNNKPALDPIIEQGMVDAAANENFLRREAEQLEMLEEASLKSMEKLAKEKERLRVEEVKRVKDQNDMFFKDTMAQFREKQKEEERLEIESQERRMRYLQDSANKNFKQAQDANKKFEDERRKELEKTGDMLAQSLSDSIMRGFEGGKSFAKNFLDSLKNMFKTAVLQPIVRFLVDSSGLTKVMGALSGVLGGSANASGLMPTGGGIGDIFGSIKDIFSAGNGSIVSSIESLGTFLSTGNGGLGDMLGGALGQYAGQIANVLPYSGAVLSLLKGDIKGAAFQGAGVAIGSALGGPIGGAIGGALGSVVGGMFGNKKPRSKIISSSANSVFENGQLISQNNNQYRTGKRFVALGAEKNLNGLNQAFAGSLGALLGEYGLNSRLSVGSFVGQRKKSARGIFNGGGYSYNVAGAGDAQSAFNSMMENVLGTGLSTAIIKSALPENIKKFFNGLTKKEDVNEAINTLITFKNALGDLPAVFDAVRNAIDTTGYKVSIDALKAQFAGTQQFVDLFYTSTEKIDIFAKQLTTTFASLNLALPTSRDEFRKLVESINVTDKATFDQRLALVSLSGSMDAYFQQLGQQRQALDALRDSNNFSNIVDFQRYQATANNFGATQANNLLSDNPTTISILNTLTNEIISLKQATIQTAKSSQKTADLLTIVTLDGEALQTKAVA